MAGAVLGTRLLTHVGGHNGLPLGMGVSRKGEMPQWGFLWESLPSGTGSRGGVSILAPCLSLPFVVVSLWFFESVEPVSSLQRGRPGPRDECVGGWLPPSLSLCALLSRNPTQLRDRRADVSAGCFVVYFSARQDNSVWEHSILAWVKACLPLPADQCICLFPHHIQFHSWVALMITENYFWSTLILFFAYNLFLEGYC